MRTIVALLLLCSVCLAQPRVSIEQDATAPPIGLFVAGSPTSLVRSGDLYTARVWPVLPVKRVTVTVAKPLTSSNYGEHLGMRIDWLKAPAGWMQPFTDFPGLLQQPYAMGHEDTAQRARSFVLYPLDWPVTAFASPNGVTVAWMDPHVQAGQSHTFRFVYMEDSGPGGEQARGLRLANRLRAYMPTWTAPPELARSHGLFGFMGQDTPGDQAEAFVRLWLTQRATFAGVILWGPMSDFGGQCCAPSLDLHSRYALLPGLSRGAGWPVFAYARPQSIEGGPIDPGWWARAVAVTLGRFRGVYADTVGFRVLDPTTVPPDAIIEGASIAYPCAALVSNAMCGGGFAVPGGGLPLTLPDGTPEPRSTSPWLTSAPWLGRAMMDGRAMLIGDQNTDYYFSGLYIVPDGRRFTDGLQRFALEYDLLICPRAMTPGWKAVVDARNAVGWFDMEREWMEPGAWLDRRTGKRWKVNGMKIEEALGVVP